MHQHLINNHILLTQSGFRRGFSCTTALAHLIDDVITALDINKIVVMVAIDFSKAFDTSDHKLVLHTLHNISISDDALEMIKAIWQIENN